MNEQLGNVNSFFIIGRPRSGTTLLSILFDAHPHVIMPGECNFILALSQKYKNIKCFDSKTLLEFVADLKLTRNYSSLGINPEQLKTNLEKLPVHATYIDFFKTVQCSSKSIFEKKDICYVGDKNPSYSNQNFHRILELFPNAKYIHLVRDYHDHIASMLHAKFRMSSPTLIAIAWKHSLNILAKYKKKYPENFYTLRYEDLVTNPEKTMIDVHAFLNLEYNPSIFDFYKKAEAYRASQPSIDFETFHKSLFKPIDKSRIGIWHTVLKGNQLSSVEFVAGRIGKKYGYTSEPHRLSPKVIYLLITWQMFYLVVIVLRGFVTSLPINTRLKVVAIIKKNRFVKILYKFIAHNP
ncbi:MAG: sulfotransferase [Bacteroidota bacterium]